MTLHAVTLQHSIATFAETLPVLLQAGQNAHLVRDGILAEPVRVAKAGVAFLGIVRADLRPSCVGNEQHGEYERYAAEHDQSLVAMLLGARRFQAYWNRSVASRLSIYRQRNGAEVRLERPVRSPAVSPRSMLTL